jgi:hypothetical protein
MKMYINLNNNKKSHSNKRCLCLDFRSFSLPKVSSWTPRAALSILTPRRVATRRATSLRDGERAQKDAWKTPLWNFARFNPVGDEVRIVARVVHFFLPVGNQSVQPPARGLE